MRSTHGWIEGCGTGRAMGAATVPEEAAKSFDFYTWKTRKYNDKDRSIPNVGSGGRLDSTSRPGSAELTTI
jgi:hypothetical protein